MNDVVWLVEYMDSVPCSVYATDEPHYTCSPWEALSFVSKNNAENWMSANGYNGNWTSVEHSFESTT